MTTPKEIAEKYIKEKWIIDVDEISILARAYLELEKELAAEKADKQRVIDIGVNMQRRVNDRVEAENTQLNIEMQKLKLIIANHINWDSISGSQEQIVRAVHAEVYPENYTDEELERLRK